KHQRKTNTTVGFCSIYNDIMFPCVKGGQIAFWDFLKSEFCEENLEFWLACQEFETSDSPEELTRRAAIPQTDYYTREIVGQSLQQPCPSCFVVAQKKIFNLMENGSFPRFTQSELYKLFYLALKQYLMTF
uniref:RGS domain-containing protein n=1 Tax=Cyclopterus lumpus TaxID=8103 RepID=A0A8C2WRF4_CYCLU